MNKQHLFDTWNSLSFNQIDQLPKIQAVYAVEMNHELLYIGSSNNLYNRLVKYLGDHPISRLFPRAEYWQLLETDFRKKLSIKQVLQREYDLNIFWVHYRGSRRNRFGFEFSLIKTLRPLMNAQFEGVYSKSPQRELKIDNFISQNRKPLVINKV